jgi:hypothetical protein
MIVQAGLFRERPKKKVITVKQEIPVEKKEEK